MSGKNILNNNLKTAEKMLKRVTRILESSKINYWLESGTLLGIIRENRLLPWDNDLDISIKECDLAKLLKIKHKFNLSGYKMKCTEYQQDNPPFNKGSIRIINIIKRKFPYNNKNKITLDIFIKIKKGDMYYWGIGNAELVKKCVPTCFYDELKSIIFNGKSYSIPNRVEDYLAHRYGDWKTPKKDYDYKKDDKAIVS